MENKKMTLILALCEVAVGAVTALVYILLGKFGITVITGGILGIVLSVLYYVLLSISVSSAADKVMENRGSAEMSEEEVKKFVEENQKQLEARVRLSFFGRLAILIVALVLAFITKWFAVFATIVPLLCVSPILMVVGRFAKGDKK